MVAFALHVLLNHDDVWAARWRIFGAYTLDQIPDDAAIRGGNVPSFDGETWAICE